MVTVDLTIEAEFCGPISMGTVAVVRALVEHLALPLTDAIALVDRCAFAGERVLIATPTRAAAEALLGALQQMPSAPRIRAAIST